MTTNTPEAWEERFNKILFDDETGALHLELGSECKCYIEDKKLIRFIRTLLHTTKVELLREVMALEKDIEWDEKWYTEGILKYDILSLASRYGITEDELNQKEV